ncbi:MAG: sulfotransferase [Nitriliruptorales bacterium]|nr:sulfotransferase [Nitriliruptorales bacterium]
MIDPSPIPMVFVGGTGRSGTTVIARLLAQHRALELIPIEARLHTDSGGLADLVRGVVSAADVVEAILGRWYRRSGLGPAQGLVAIADRDRLERALDRFSAAAQDDAVLAAGGLLRDLFDHVAADGGALGWVEMTPPNIRMAAELHRMLPGARFVHTIRDGRDVACSVVPLDWGPDDHLSAIDWWADGVRAGARALASVPPEQAHVLWLEDLLGDGRDEALASMLARLRLEPDVLVSAYLDVAMSPTRGNVARWQAELAGDLRNRVDARYREQLGGLVADGVIEMPGVRT